MKICHNFIFFSIKFAGGTSDLMYKLCKYQSKIGIEPCVYTGNYQFDPQLAAELSDTEFRINRSFLDKQGLSIMPGLFKLARNELKSFSVVHMHVFRTFQNAVLYFFCRRFKIPYIIDAHGAVPYASRKNYIKRLFDKILGRKMLRNASYLIAETQVGAQEYLAIAPKLNKEKIKVISPPFSIDEYQDLPRRGIFREKYGLYDKNLIMFLGRINYIKGIDFLIKGFAKLLRLKPDSCLVVIGPDDGHLDELKQLIQTLGIDKQVLFTGFMAGTDKLSALVDADVVCQTSRQEQGAWAPFEAILCGTPIVVTEHTGAGEDVKRINAGSLVKFDDVNGLADKIEKILQSPQPYKEQALAAKNYIETHMSMNQRVHEYKDLYQACIQQPA